MKNRVLIALAVLLAVTGCRRPHTPTPPPAPFMVTTHTTNAETGAPLVGATTYSDAELPEFPPTWVGDNGYASFIVPAPGWNACAKKELFLTRCAPVAEAKDQTIELPLTPTAPPPPVFKPRTGVVFNLQRNYTDADGKFLSLGTSLFWELWGVQNDLDRLKDHNLQPIAKRGLQDVRVILVLPPDGLWSARRVDPFAPTFQSIVARAVDLNYNDFGLRTGITIFGGRVGTDDQHAQIVQSVCAALAGRQERITHVEIANEGGNNGFGREELWRHARAVQACLPGTLVSLTSAENYPNGPDDIYPGSPATMFAFHPDRDTNGDGGEYRPSRQPYGYRELNVPTIGENGEPRGPQSSITETNDPTIIAADAIMTWLSGWGRYVLHTGSGVYGIAPEDAARVDCGGRPCDGRGRPANWEDTARIDEIADALVTLSKKLPQDLPGWSRLTHANPSKQADWPFVTESNKQWDKAWQDFGTRGYAAWNGNRFFAIVLRQKAPIDVIARGVTEFNVRSVRTYEVLQSVRLEPGATYVLPVFDSAVILEGTE